MHASTYALLEQLIDYAGLFPPAKLPLEEAVRTYLDLKGHSPHRFMLGRFVCPAARLAELLPLAKAHPGGSSLQVTALGAPGATWDEFSAQLASAVAAIREFRRAFGSEIVADALEIALPAGADSERAGPALGQAAELLTQSGLRGFFEVPAAASWNSDVTKISLTMTGSALGLKIRCGGLTKSAFPTHAQVAHFIASCRAARLPWKATAGLHHPRQHWDEALQLWHHGFLNVFLAGVFAWTHSLSDAEVRDIVSDGGLRVFRAEPGRILWRDRECSTEQIAAARRQFATSFGSCSFEEPCGDLLELGLLSREGESAR